MSESLMNNIMSLTKRRGFLFPGSAIYGGLANAWDYGPLGVELKNNIKQEWWKWFVQKRTDIVGIDPAIFMNPKVWEVSGHVKEFADDNFNLLFKTSLGPQEDSSSEVYLRGEIAQAMFINFAEVQRTMRMRLPFGIAAQGKVFRNEITPGNFIFRTREFDLMEFEYFVRKSEWKEHFAFWQEEMKKWMEHLGIDMSHVHEVNVPKKDLAHYSKKTLDFEYDYPFGRKELYGLAYRTDFDLKNHAEQSGENLFYTDPDTGEKFIPHVIEPTFGLDRSVLVALLEAYTEEEDVGRVVMKFPHWMAPVKLAVLPLVKNDKKVRKSAHEVFDLLSGIATSQYDEGGSIGRRYRRQDEAGTPFCVTIDFDTLQDDAVTIRDRDTMEQTRIKIKELTTYFHDLLL